MKQVTAREFQHCFGALSKSLKPGELIQVTRRGKVDGIYQKAPRTGIKQPNFLERVEKLNYSAKVGAQLLKHLTRL